MHYYSNKCHRVFVSKNINGNVKLYLYWSDVGKISGTRFSSSFNDASNIRSNELKGTEKKKSKILNFIVSECRRIEEFYTFSPEF